MAEHAARYDRFATALVKAGFAVYANDHRGHGKTAGTHDKEGILAPKDGWRLCIDDMHELTKIIKKEHPKTKFFLLGHSMGSFMTQGYIALYGNELDGCILSGTGGNGGSLVIMGNLVAKIVSAIFGRNTKSPALNQMSFGAFNNAFKPNRTTFDWLSRDNAEVDKYIKDEWCGFICTAGFFVDMTGGLKWTHKKSTMQQIPKDLPLYLYAGAKDPVSQETKTIQALIADYKNLGIKEVTSKFYENARHETLNETNRDEVTKDVIKWIEEHLK